MGDRARSSASVSMSATELPASRHNKAQPIAVRPHVSPHPTIRRRWRLPAVTTLWAWTARNLLILFIVSHHILLIGAMLGTIEWAIALASNLQSRPWDAGIWAGTAALGWLGWLLSVRLWSALPGLVTASYDSADDEAEGTCLDRTKHAALFAVIEEVARLVGAPVPDEICVSADARCFAFEQRDFGVTTRRTMVLVLGLPHLLILSAAELRVIVGHELAHIRQKDTTLAVFFFRFAESLRTYLDSSREAVLGWLNPVAWFEWGSQVLFQ